MKKKNLLALVMSLFLTSATMAQEINVVHTYTGPDNSITMDDAMGYKAVKTSTDGFAIVARDNAMTQTTVFTGNVTGEILSMALNMRVMDKSIVLIVMTSTKVWLKSLTLIGTTYTETSSEFNAATGTTFQSLIPSKSPFGMGYLIKSSDGSGTITTAGKINFNGSYASSVSVAEPSARYFGIVSDNEYHYLVYGLPDGIYIERRNDDNVLSLNNQFIPYAASNVEVTDIRQDQFGINIMIKDGTGNLVRKRVFKAGFMTDYMATLSYPIGANTNGDAAIFVNRSVAMFGGTAVKTNDSWTGSLTQTNSSAFGSSYSKFRAYAIGDHYFIYYATGTDGKVKMLLMNSATLQRHDSLMIQDGAENVITGFYRENDTTVVAYGYSKDGSITKAKEWVIRTPFDQTLSVKTTQQSALKALEIYPNPATNQINISTNHDMNISISSITGQQIMMVRATTEQTTVNISTLPSGVYVITGNDEKHTYRQTLIKN